MAAPANSVLNIDIGHIYVYRLFIIEVLMLCLLGPVGVFHIGRAELAFQEPRRKRIKSLSEQVQNTRIIESFKSPLQGALEILARHYDFSKYVLEKHHCFSLYFVLY